MPFVEITLVEGRSNEAKRALMRRVTDAVEEAIGAPRETIRVVLREVPAFHWAVAGEPKGEPE
jgi:4-oxalocrotonate tautomerase